MRKISNDELARSGRLTPGTVWSNEDWLAGRGKMVSRAALAGLATTEASGKGDKIPCPIDLVA